MKPTEIEIHNPATGELAGVVHSSSDREVRLLAAKGRRAQVRWIQLSPRVRARLLARFHDLVLDEETRILDTIQSETGKSRRDAFTEVISVLGTARYYGSHGRKHLRERRGRGAIPFLTRTRIGWQPYSLVGLIAPWNYPFLLSVADALPALQAGCAVLVKPSERTPLSAELGRQLLVEAGLDPDLMGVVHGNGEQAQSLLEQVDYVAFTGGERAGRAVALAAARRSIGYSLELGGKNPMLVLEGASVERAVDGLLAGAFANGGQACIGLERVYVVQQLYEQFLARAADRVARLKTGWSTGWDIDVGSLIGRDHVERVSAHVADAVRCGASIVQGGRSRSDLGPAFFEPTLLADVPSGSAPSMHETFGPVASIYRVGDAEEALRKANDSPYGLNASIWGATGRQALSIARRLRTGSVGIHASLQIYGTADAPMGGMKASGNGRRHGPEGIQRFAQTQSIVSSPSGLGGYDGLWFHLNRPGRARWMGRILRIWRRLPGLR